MDSDFHNDLKWFIKVSHGCYFFKKKQFNRYGDLDACLSGMGAVCADEEYTVPTLAEYDGSNIAVLEMHNILLAVRVWSKE